MYITLWCLNWNSHDNLAMLDITNSSLDTVIFDPKEILGISDLRSLGYYKIKQGILQQSLSKYYRFQIGRCSM